MKEITSNLIRKFAFPKELPTKRKNIMRKVSIGNHKLFMSNGEFDDGTLSEIFLDIHKEGTATRALLNCFAIAVSVGIQWGVPLEIYVDYFADVKFEPNGVVRGYEKIKNADSIISLIFRILAIEYLGMKEYQDIPDEVVEVKKKVCKICTESEQDDNGVVIGDAPLCKDCGHLTVRNGTCFKCLNCGSTSGCS
jgi:ribonucleoside-diphosphate reductase alpha chain